MVMCSSFACARKFVLFGKPCVKCEVFCYKKKCNEGGPASGTEDSAPGGGADSISLVGAVKWR